MMNKFSALYLLLSLFLLTGCGGKSHKKVVADTGAPVELSYARLFTISHSKGYTTVTVANPWKTSETYATYYLVKDEKIEVPAGGQKVTIPVKSLMANSATHLGFIELIGELEHVTGVCSGDFIYNPVIREAIRKGKVQDLGDAFNLNIEQLLKLRPHVVMTTAYNADDENSRKMRQSGIPIIYNVEWQETSLLGRAEWIKFVGAFFDREEQADSIFRKIEQRYNEVKELAGAFEYKPTVLSGQDYRGSWSMPGGQSFNAHLFHDAGANYHYKNDATTGSISATIEEALMYFGLADVWVGVQASTLEELGRMDSRYKLFKAYKEGNVYNTNKRTTPTGGNDYWEGAVARPDLLLSDMIRVFHPEALPDYELTYLQKLDK